jgi:hypothetical protein
MNAGKSVFFQVIGRVPHWEFQRLVRLHDPSDVRGHFSAWDHFLALAFAQMTFGESLRVIESRLSTARLAYHLGFGQRVTRSTQARANEERDWSLNSALAHKMLNRARLLYQDEATVLDLEMPV